jgi:hypothetical protein
MSQVNFIPEGVILPDPAPPSSQSGHGVSEEEPATNEYYTGGRYPVASGAGGAGAGAGDNLPRIQVNDSGNPAAAHHPGSSESAPGGFSSGNSGSNTASNFSYGEFLASLSPKVAYTVSSHTNTTNKNSGATRSSTRVGKGLTAQRFVVILLTDE